MSSTQKSENSSDSMHPLNTVLIRKKGRRPKDIDALTPVEKKRLEARGKTPKQLREIEVVIKQLIERKKENGGTLRGTGMRKWAAKKLDVHPTTIDRWLDAYEEDPCVESLADKAPGREPGRLLSELQKAVACVFYFSSTLNTTDSKGNQDTVPMRPDIKYIYRCILKFCPTPKRSIDTLRRFLKDLKRDDPLVEILARKGKDYLRDKIVPTKNNDVSRPNQRWQIDARILPIYIIYNGMVCTVSLLVILDDFSRYPVRWRIIPRKVRDEDGFPKRADFTARDVGILLASAMYHERVRPEDLYTDNGSQIIAIREFLEDLTDENETLVRMTNTIPGRPRGRGKIEKFLGLMNKLVMDIAGFIRDEKDLASVNAARTAPNLKTLEYLCEQIDEYMEKLRDEPYRQGGKKTRRQLYQKTGALPAPPIRRLMALVPEKEERFVAVSNWKIVFKEEEEEYEPRIEDEEGMMRWFEAVARPEFVPLKAANLDTGWKFEVCLDGEHWHEGVRKSEQNVATDRYASLRNGALRRIQERLDSTYAIVLEIVKPLGAHEARKHIITKQPTLPSELLSPSESGNADKSGRSPANGAPASQDTPNTASSPVGARSQSTRARAARRTAAHASPPPNDWSDLPDMDEVLKRADQNVKGQMSDG